MIADVPEPDANATGTVPFVGVSSNTAIVDPELNPDNSSLAVSRG
jgi:hypothetical protein